MESSQGAVSYTSRSTATPTCIGAKVYSTKTTSLVVPDPLTVGDWYWRVTADQGYGPDQPAVRPSRGSTSRPLPAPQITSPANDVNQAVEDVVLDWTPVPGRPHL